MSHVSLAGHREATLRSRGNGSSEQLTAPGTGTPHGSRRVECQTPDINHRRDDQIAPACAYDLAILMEVRDRLNNNTAREVAETIRRSLPAHVIRRHNRHAPSSQWTGHMAGPLDRLSASLTGRPTRPNYSSAP